MHAITVLLVLLLCMQQQQMLQIVQAYSSKDVASKNLKVHKYSYNVDTTTAAEYELEQEQHYAQQQQQQQHHTRHQHHHKQHNQHHAHARQQHVSSESIGTPSNAEIVQHHYEQQLLHANMMHKNITTTSNTTKLITITKRPTESNEKPQQQNTQHHREQHLSKHYNHHMHHAHHLHHGQVLLPKHSINAEQHKRTSVTDFTTARPSTKTTTTTTTMATSTTYNENNLAEQQSSNNTLSTASAAAVASSSLSLSAEHAHKRPGTLAASSSAADATSFSSSKQSNDNNRQSKSITDAIFQHNFKVKHKRHEQQQNHQQQHLTDATHATTNSKFNWKSSIDVFSDNELDYNYTDDYYDEPANDEQAEEQQDSEMAKNNMLQSEEENVYIKNKNNNENSKSQMHDNNENNNDNDNDNENDSDNDNDNDNENERAYAHNKFDIIDEEEIPIFNNDKYAFTHYDTAHARVTRDHHHQHQQQRNFNHLDYKQTDDQDYADDEPYRNSAEQNDSPGDLTDKKFRELGTREAVQQSRDQYLQEQRMKGILATQHLNRMAAATRCYRPMPRVIEVSNQSSKQYKPRCTILHRCGEDTGCCESTRQVCTVKRSEPVNLYFFVTEMGTDVKKVEILTMQNHTECGCVDLANLPDDYYMQRNKRSEFGMRRRYRAAPALASEQSYNHIQPRRGYETMAKEQTYECNCPKYYDVILDKVAVDNDNLRIRRHGKLYQQQHQQQLVRQSQSHHQQQQKQQQQETHHAHFYRLSDSEQQRQRQRAAERHQPYYRHESSAATALTYGGNGQHSHQRVGSANCRCDCLPGNAACQRLKEGSEGFSIEDRKHISAATMKTPTCEYGIYSAQTGRCPLPQPKNHNHEYGLS